VRGDMKTEHRIAQHDVDRPILTELIPYEVPLRFSFAHVYELFKADASDPLISNTTTFVFGNDSGDFVPYSYSARSGEGKRRSLGLIHPLLLKSFAELYIRHHGVILSLCGKSKWSLRKPARVAETYVIRDGIGIAGASADLVLEDGDEPPDPTLTVGGGTSLPAHASSFFVYESYGLLQRFIESRELLLLERHFVKCRRIDVAKCFDNIYTHSLSWAIKGKEAAKREKHAKHTFDAIFDTLMRRANHGETHGILIGAEVSRIYAELIFQEIDVRLQSPLEHQGFNEGRDYTIRRYVDDYFIFYNEDRVATAVQSGIESGLKRYKLYLNEKKSSEWVRPFMTDISSAKVHLRSMLADAVSIHVREADDGSIVLDQQPAASSQTLKRIRQTLVDCKVEYPFVSAFVLKHTHIYAKSAMRLIRGGKVPDDACRRWCRSVLETCFFVFAVDCRFRTAILLGNVIRDVYETARTLTPHTAGEIRDVILREMISLLIQSCDGSNDNHLELANVLLCVREVDEYWRIPPSLLKSIGFTSSESSEPIPDYFTAVAMIFFMSDRPEYASLQAALIKSATDRVLGAVKIREDTELFCFALDLMSCPWCDAPTKLSLAAKLAADLKTKNGALVATGDALTYLTSRTWFFDWRSDVATDDYLRRKELYLSY
jgi:Reverse transcriptase (RNA-dependent DNA polymerase)